ncbi:murein L,D-transpeptidase family protein [Corallincola platygyrae]|uniref:Murein L,D-transpeptidase family protein n=1 Tax=Corallincola platygyrae TaxID=1193278 RepID=A0ABW4XR12_9GAMM
MLFNCGTCLAGDSKPALPSSKRSERAIETATPKLDKALKAMGLELGAPVFIRIFKQPAELEVWLEHEDAQFRLFKRYPICAFSGELGPKQQMGDMQSPEGFYFVTPQRLNPWSQFHLSFNLGYPNRYDRHYGRTGSALMVHGDCVSIGCYAMTDPYIDEIYTLMVSALENGQPYVRVHAFPFPMTSEALDDKKDHRWHAFWVNLKQGYDYFEHYRRPPNTEVKSGRYVFEHDTAG